MDRGDRPADPRIGKRPDPALTAPERFRPRSDAADDQHIDHAGDHQRGAGLLGGVFNGQELRDIADEQGGLIGILRDVNDFGSNPNNGETPPLFSN